jgi:hypothetical protein
MWCGYAVFEKNQLPGERIGDTLKFAVVVQPGPMYQV